MWLLWKFFCCVASSQNCLRDLMSIELWYWRFLSSLDMDCTPSPPQSSQPKLIAASSPSDLSIFNDRCPFNCETTTNPTSFIVLDPRPLLTLPSFENPILSLDVPLNLSPPLFESYWRLPRLLEKLPLATPSPKCGQGKLRTCIWQSTMRKSGKRLYWRVLSLLNEIPSMECKGLSSWRECWLSLLCINILLILSFSIKLRVARLIEDLLSQFGVLLILLGRCWGILIIWIDSNFTIKEDIKG